MRRIISILLENEAGALSRIVGLFAQRNYNIETLTVAPTDDATMSRLTITTSGGNDYVSPASVTTLTGKAPYAVATIEVNGTPYPVKWTSFNNFSITSSFKFLLIGIRCWPIRTSLPSILSIFEAATMKDLCRRINLSVGKYSSTDLKVR